MNTPSGKTQATKQYGDQGWQDTIRWLKIILRAIQRIARGIEVTLYEMYPDKQNPDVHAEQKISGEKNEARNNANSDQDPVV